MHIVFYISRFGIGGIQTFVIQMAKELVQLPNVKVSIFCHYPELLDASLNEPIPPSVEIVAVSKNKRSIVLINVLRNWIKKIWKGFDFKEWLTTRAFLRFVKKENVTLIHNNIQLGDYNAYWAQKQLGVPYITTLHGAYKEIVGSDDIDVATYRQVFNRLFQTASNIVYLSPANLLPFTQVLGDLSPQQKQKIVRIFNGLKKVSIAPKKSTTDFVLGLVARGVAYKGWEEAIEAVLYLVKEKGYQNLKLRLYGASDYLDELQKKYGASKDFILFCGATYEPLKVVQEFTVGLLPTYLPQEEMPFTIIEYLACGIPVIATDKGAIVEMLTADQDVAGAIVPFAENGKADVLALAGAIEQFVVNEAYLEQKKRFAQQAFEKFNIEHTVKQYYKLYQNALKK